MNTNEYINHMNASRRNDRAKLNPTSYIKDHPIILTGASGRITKTLVEANGRIVDFPGIEPWTAERVRHIVGDQPKGFARYGISFGSYKDDLFTVYWTIQEDGRYSADEDGFGMTDDEKVVLFTHINGEGSFVNPFRLYERGGIRYYYGEKEMSPRPLFRYRLQSGYAGKKEISIDRCCENHEEVVIPESIHDIPVSEIGTLAFTQCENVRRIVLPDTIDYIGSQAFDRCTALESIRMPAHMAQRILSSYMFRNCTSLRSLTIPYGVEGIGREVFSGCTSLEEIILPQSIRLYGPSFLKGCEGLKRLTMPGGMRFITVFPFDGSPLQSHIRDIQKSAIAGQAYTFEGEQGCENELHARESGIAPGESFAEDLFLLGDGFVLENRDHTFQYVAEASGIGCRVFRDTDSHGTFIFAEIVMAPHDRTDEDCALVARARLNDVGLLEMGSARQEGKLGDMTYCTCTAVINRDLYGDAVVVAHSGSALLIVGKTETALQHLRPADQSREAPDAMKRLESE